jgi:ribosomal protein L4
MELIRIEKYIDVESAKEGLKSEKTLTKYIKNIEKNRIQFNRFKPGAGRRQCTKPSGTGRGRSRQPRKTDPARGLVVSNIPPAVGGPRSYHDRPYKMYNKINKKEKKLSIRQIFLNSCLYSNTYVINNENENELYNRNNTLKLFYNYLENKEKIGKKVNRVYNTYRKTVVFVHDDEEIFRVYRNTQIQLVNLLHPYYLPLHLYKNSNHVIVYTKSAIDKVKNKYAI